MARRVLGWQIEDSEADSWTAQVVVYAESRPAALASLRAAGLHKRQIGHEFSTKQSTGDEYAIAVGAPGVMFRRRFDEGAGTNWERLAPGTSLP